MSTDLQGSDPRPTIPELLAEFGDETLSIQSLFRFCFVPSGRQKLLGELALDEDWGPNDFVLLKYLAVHLRLAVEQGAFVWNGDQMVLTAGRLTTRTGAPVYVGLVRNSAPEENPWVLNWVGERPSSAELPEPADLGEWPRLDPRLEVVVAFDPSAEDRRPATPALAALGAVTQVSAITGAVHWSLHRGLAVPQIHGAGRGYFVPLYLTERDDVSRRPDAVAPVLTRGGRIAVRTLLDPHVAYAPARAVAERAELLPAWLRDAWRTSLEEGLPDAG